jgi:hypothetical protein
MDLKQTTKKEVSEMNRFFYGKLMTAEDFKEEQQYYQRTPGLVSRIIHGIGLIGGLEVSKVSEATGGVVSLSIPANGYKFVRNIDHRLLTDTAPAIILGLKINEKVIWENDFIGQRGIINLIIGEYGVGLPKISFKAIVDGSKKFDLIVVSKSNQTENITIQWWAIPTVIETTVNP